VRTMWVAEMRGVVERSEDMRKLTDVQAQRSKSLIEIATASASPGYPDGGWVPPRLWVSPMS
jgi:hypothetical protein